MMSSRNRSDLVLVVESSTAFVFLPKSRMIYCDYKVANTIRPNNDTIDPLAIKAHNLNRILLFIQSYF